MTADICDNTIFKQIQAGNEKAFDKLFLEYYSPLCRFACIYLKDQFASEEIIQDLFIYLWEHRNDLHIQSSVTSYLFTAAKNRTLNYIQKSKTRKIYENSYAAERNTEVSEIHDSIDLKEIHLKLAKAMDDLPSKCRNIFHLSRNKNMSNKEIAAHLGISVKTVENQMTIALKRIKFSLSTYLGLILLIIRD